MNCLIVNHFRISRILEIEYLELHLKKKSYNNCTITWYDVYTIDVQPPDPIHVKLALMAFHCNMDYKKAYGKIIFKKYFFFSYFLLQGAVLEVQLFYIITKYYSYRIRNICYCWFINNHRSNWCVY